MDVGERGFQSETLRPLRLDMGKNTVQPAQLFTDAIACMCRHAWSNIHDILIDGMLLLTFNQTKVIPIQNSL